MKNSTISALVALVAAACVLATTGGVAQAAPKATPWPWQIQATFAAPPAVTAGKTVPFKVTATNTGKVSVDIDILIPIGVTVTNANALGIKPDPQGASVVSFRSVRPRKSVSITLKIIIPADATANPVWCYDSGIRYGYLTGAFGGWKVASIDGNVCPAVLR